MEPIWPVLITKNSITEGINWKHFIILGKQVELFHTKVLKKTTPGAPHQPQVSSHWVNSWDTHSKKTVLWRKKNNFNNRLRGIPISLTQVIIRLNEPIKRPTRALLRKHFRPTIVGLAIDPTNPTTTQGDWQFQVTTRIFLASQTKTKWNSNYIKKDFEQKFRK